MTITTQDINRKEIIITRIFDVPRQFMWKAWTEPKLVQRWWGPNGFTSPIYRIDLRVGSGYLNCMRSPEGKDFWSKGVYREIVAPERIVATDSFANAKGNTVPATYYGVDSNWPRELLITVTFEEHNGKTKLTLKHSGLDGISDIDREDMRQGWKESFDKLDEYLAELNLETHQWKSNALKRKEMSRR